MNSKAIGERSEALILARLIERGYAVALPFGNNQRYDMVVDDGGKLLKVQCKTGHFINGCVCFKTSSVNGFTGKRRAYAGEADLFIVYCPAIKGFYKVDVNSAGKSEVRLRVSPTKGGQTSGVRWAKDYEL